MKIETAFKLRKLSILTLSAVLLSGVVGLGSLAAPTFVGASSSMTENLSTLTKTISVVWNPSYYEFNGVKMMPLKEEQGFIYNNTNYVPLRFVAYGLNKSVGWDQQSKTVKVWEPSAREQVVITEYQANAQYRALKDSGEQIASAAKITIQQVPITYIFDGIENKTEDTLPGLAYKGRIYVPMRFVGEALGYQVSWDKEAQAVIMKSSDDQKQEHTNTNTNNENSSANSSGSNAGATDSAAGGMNVGAGANNVQSGNMSYTDIVTNAESTLRVLEGDAQNQLYSLLSQYANASSLEEKSRIKAEGEKVFNDTTEQFRNLIKETSTKLTANGHSTAIIQEYEDYYNQRVEFGLSLLEQMIEEQ